MLLLHGASGVGKSSFLLAGVAPWLDEENLGFQCLDERDEDDRSHRTRSSLFVRATADPFAQIAHRLQHFCDTPFTYRTPAGKDVVVPLAPRLLEAVDAADSHAPIDADELRELLAARPYRLAEDEAKNEIKWISKRKRRSLARSAKDAEDTDSC